jgi:hypothetical protein
MTTDLTTLLHIERRLSQFVVILDDPHSDGDTELDGPFASYDEAEDYMTDMTSDEIADILADVFSKHYEGSI